MATSPLDALNQIKADPSLSKQFLNNPWSTLQSLGVDIDELKNTMNHPDGYKSGEPHTDIFPACLVGLKWPGSSDDSNDNDDNDDQ